MARAVGGACPVCLQPPVPARRVRTDCGHVHCEACAAMALRRGMHGTGGRCPVCREVVRVVEPDTEGDGSGVGGSTEAIRVRREGIEYRLRFERGEDVLRRVRTTFGVPCGVPVKLVRGGAVLDADAVATAVTKGKPMHLVSASESPADERAQRSRAYWGAWRTYLAYIFARGLELATDACRGLPAALSLFFRSAVSQEYSPAPHRHRGHVRDGEAQALERAAADARVRGERRSAELARRMHGEQLQGFHED